ncbi:hypothetical protein [Phenylobacterium deserti]|nr:hypothetical protein [Phenylobacterium deserti]
MTLPEHPEKPRSNSMPPFVWAILGILVVGLFVLVASLLRG